MNDIFLFSQLTMMQMMYYYPYLHYYSQSFYPMGNYGIRPRRYIDLSNWTTLSKPSFFDRVRMRMRILWREYHSIYCTSMDLLEFIQQESRISYSFEFLYRMEWHIIEIMPDYGCYCIDTNRYSSKDRFNHAFMDRFDGALKLLKFRKKITY